MGGKARMVVSVIFVSLNLEVLFF